MQTERPVFVVTRGSPLALAQTELALAQCRSAFPGLDFRVRIVKTTGDRLQKVTAAGPGALLSKGLFTKELEEALIGGEADMAVHSLKDLPIELPRGLTLAAVLNRGDARDVLVVRAADLPGRPCLSIDSLPPQATVATSSPRRIEQLLARRPDLQMVEIRGNVGTRLRKLAENADLHALVLAAAGILRLGYDIRPDGRLATGGNGYRDGRDQTQLGAFRVACLDTTVMVPCVGQGAIGIETRSGDGRMAAVCERLDHYESRQRVTAERAFLEAMGGGCRCPVAAYAEVDGQQLQMRAVLFRTGQARRGEARGPLSAPEQLGRQIALELSSGEGPLDSRGR